jgi:hypothetical protein
LQTPTNFGTAVTSVSIASGNVALGAHALPTLLLVSFAQASCAIFNVLVGSVSITILPLFAGRSLAPYHAHS